MLWNQLAKLFAGLDAYGSSLFEKVLQTLLEIYYRLIILKQISSNMHKIF